MAGWSAGWFAGCAVCLAGLHASVRRPCGWFIGLLLADVMVVRVVFCGAGFVVWFFLVLGYGLLVCC